MSMDALLLFGPDFHPPGYVGVLRVALVGPRMHRPGCEQHARSMQPNDSNDVYTILEGQIERAACRPPSLGGDDE